MSDHPVLSLPAKPRQAMRRAIAKALVRFNEGAGGPENYEPFAVLLDHPRTGRTIGGLWGDYYYDWLFVRLLVVPEDARGTGLGRRMMAEAEAFARSRHAVGIWLDTFSFQARGFYEKLGYTLFGTLDDHPRGARRFFMEKRF